MTVAADRFDLEAVAAGLVAEFGPRAATSGHELELGDAGAHAAQAVHARGDEARVVQIGRILVENAIVHTPPGRTVTLSAEVAGGRATLTVTDDGPGIPDQARTQVFERFYRLDGTIASGSGLGLAIARELAELMGGRIELESRPGLTRFTLVLAAAAAGRPLAHQAAEKG